MKKIAETLNPCQKHKQSHGRELRNRKTKETKCSEIRKKATKIQNIYFKDAFLQDGCPDPI